MEDKDAGKSQGKRQVESIPDGSPSEAEAEASVLTSKSAMEDKEKKPTKRARIVWTAELQEKFVDAVNQLGVDVARPSTIMKLMNVDGLTEPSVKNRLQKYRRSLREQQGSEGGTLVALQVSEGGKSGVDQAFDTDNMQMRMKGVNASDAHKMFDKTSQRTWDSKSCATQTTVSSSASQHEVSSASASASASNFRRLDQSSRSDFTPLVLESFVQKGAKVGGHQHEDEDQNSKRALQKDKMFSIVLTPSDVGQLNRLVIPKDYARTCLPKFYPGENSLLLSVEDPVGKPWIFSYSYQSSSDTYLLTQGWSRFVKENLLQAGNIVSFYRGLGEQGKNKLFISWLRNEKDAAPAFSPRLLKVNACKTLSLALGGSRYSITGKMDWKKNPSPTLYKQITNSSEATQKPFSRGIVKVWSSDVTPDDRLGSVVRFVLNIVRWKRRALSIHTELVTMEDQTSYAECVNPTVLIEPLLSWDFSSLLLLNPFLSNAPLFNYASLLYDALHYCALFPPDHEFEKDTLVQVWTALGISVDEPMERFASLLFEYCLTKGYFQFLRTNLITGKAMYNFTQKTQSLPLSFGSHIKLSMVSPQVTHASIRCCDLKHSIALPGQRFKQLRALIFLHGLELSFKQVPRNFFLSLSELQVLDLSKTRLMELPTSIGNMKCLCLLDLSDTLIKRLPEGISCLEKLQTLKLKGCLNISTLPKGMRKLINLRHLDFDVFRQLRSMPEGMGDLANIQTLSAFLVGVEDGCSIRQIKNMNYLSGSFCISRLENVLAKDEAEEACLSNKAQLKKIELHWSDSQDEDVAGYEKVLSSLQPNTSLEELNISCYGGLELPSWICDPKFSQLVCITLFECENCLFLPSLGQLPSLKYLNIVNFHKLKVIDHKFYGGLGIQGYVSFPKLEKLTVENMSSLEEWSGIRSFEFPCLLNLTVKHCPKLQNLCTLSSLCSLENLEISHCAVLASCPDEKLPAQVETFIIEGCPSISAKFLNGGQDWQKVAHIPHIWIDHKKILLG